MFEAKKIISKSQTLIVPYDVDRSYENVKKALGFWDLVTESGLRKMSQLNKVTMFS